MKAHSPVNQELPARMEVVISIITFGLSATILLFLIRWGGNDDTHMANSQSVSASATNMILTHEAAPPVTFQKIHIPKPKPALSKDSNSADYEIFVANRIHELQNLAMTGDPNSLTMITSELDNRDPRIWKAALSATIQFGSQDAIPALQDAYAHTDDPQEKIGIQKAIAFLRLPSMSEIATNMNDESN
jgi:hypothetical protein